MVCINPDEIHVSDSNWLDVLYLDPGQVRYAFMGIDGVAV